MVSQNDPHKLVAVTSLTVHYIQLPIFSCCVTLNENVKPGADFSFLDVLNLRGYQGLVPVFIVFFSDLMGENGFEWWGSSSSWGGQGLMWCLTMRMVHRMMLILLTVPVLIRAVFGPGLGGLGIIRLTMGSVSLRHSQYSCSLLLYQFKIVEEELVDRLHPRTPSHLDGAIQYTLYRESETH